MKIEIERYKGWIERTDGSMCMIINDNLRGVNNFERFFTPFVAATNASLPRVQEPTVLECFSA